MEPTNLLTPDRELIKVQKPPQCSLVNQSVLLGLLIGISVRGYLEEQKWVKDNHITTAYPGVGDSLQSWEPGAHCAVCRLLNGLESVLSWQLWLVSASCRPGLASECVALPLLWETAAKLGWAFLAAWPIRETFGSSAFSSCLLRQGRV